ncbi:MAG: nicotinamide-nucleotide amidohydrolase family protein [bacterium]|nr:nicotinamide-nucleotide amidohydrolase family protein [bacterium]
MRPPVYVLSTGTELSTGRSIDTNAPMIARTLAERGFPIAGLGTLPDDTKILRDEIDHLLKRPDVGMVIMTGGLGPTDDDLTVDVLSDLAGVPTVEDPDHLRKLEALAKRYPTRIRLDNTRRQIRVAGGSRVLKNERGLAPGMLVTIATKDAGFPEKYVAAMPGVPQEMELMFRGDLIPVLEERFPESNRARTVFYIYNMGESTFQARMFGIVRRGQSEEKPLAKLEELPEDFRWGVTAAAGHLKVFYECDDAAVVERLEDLAKTEMAEHYLPEIADLMIHNLCAESGRRIAAAESCTGGLIGKTLTDRPGSSSYFLGSLVTYANQAKSAVLDVSPTLLEKYGAVSPECARAMAVGAQIRMGSDFAVAVTGIAGPDGGTASKPVGTVFVGVTGRGVLEDQVTVHALSIPLDRDRIRQNTAQIALFHLYHYMKAAQA